MRVTALELFAVPPRWLFLRLSTDERGEPIVEGRALGVPPRELLGGQRRGRMRLWGNENGTVAEW